MTGDVGRSKRLPQAYGTAGLSGRGYAARWAGAALLLAAAVVGCGTPTSRKPNLYEVRGRVIDVETKQGLASARIRLQAVMPGAIGRQVLASYAVADADGRYRAELASGFAEVRHAAEIRVDASVPGYKPGGVNLAPPRKNQDYYGAPDILLAPGQAPHPPPDMKDLGIILTEPPKPNPLPWKRGR